MAKLSFFYTAINGGKTTVLLQVLQNYETQGYRVLLVKPDNDLKEKVLKGKLGNTREIDILLEEKESFFSKMNQVRIQASDCILVDEAQFLSREQVEELWELSKLNDVAVICYGLKTNFKSELFDGSKRLLELADEISELPVLPLCSCGKKARFNARVMKDDYTMIGEEKLLEGTQEDVHYIPLCGSCYLKEVLKHKVY